jgi:hypothetical protein
MRLLSSVSVISLGPKPGMPRLSEPLRTMVRAWASVIIMSPAMRGASTWLTQDRPPLPPAPWQVEHAAAKIFSGGCVWIALP